MDHDQLYAGQGNDDLFGGVGTNVLSAWSRQPDSNPFGVIDPTTGKLEDTDINRMLGSAKDDSLYGGTGIDFLYGNGGSDVLYRNDGTTLNSMDGGIAGSDWIDYARQSDRIWYVGGSNADDQAHARPRASPGPRSTASSARSATSPGPASERSLSSAATT